MVTLIITAAGTGSRMNLGYNKMLYKVNDEYLLNITINKFLNISEIDQIIVTANRDDINLYKNIVNNKITVIEGSDTRGKSVYEGIKISKNECILIHDGARPFIDREDIANVITELKDNDAVLLATRVVETTKEIKNGKLITINRDNLIHAKTPQGVKKSLIGELYKKAIDEGYNFTDDISLIEMYTNIPIKIVYGNSRNVKITTKEDLRLLEGDSY